MSAKKYYNAIFEELDIENTYNSLMHATQNDAEVVAVLATMRAEHIAAIKERERISAILQRAQSMLPLRWQVAMITALVANYPDPVSDATMATIDELALITETPEFWARTYDERLAICRDFLEKATAGVA